MGMNWNDCRTPFALVAILMLAGCIGSGSTALTTPEVDPQAAAKAAMDTYDKNSDGALGGDELAAVPAIERVLPDYDKDGNKSVSQQELADRLAAIFRSGSMTPFTCTILFNNQPLEGAEVVFQPETFLADQLKPASGTTSYDGVARIMVPDTELPEENRGLKSMYMGLYKVSVSHPSAKLPAAYQGENSVLGYEVSGLSTWGDKVTFRLDAKGTRPK